MAADNERILNGGEPATGSVNTVKDVPEDFKKWVTENSDRIAKAGNKGKLPYFMADNGTFDKETGMYSLNIKSLKAEPAKPVKTQAQIDDIKARWDARNKQNALIIKTADNVLAVAEKYPEVDTAALRDIIQTGNTVKIKSATISLAKEISVIKKDDQFLSSLIPDVRNWKQQFTSEELHKVYDAVKSKLDEFDAFTLEKQLEKLKFEINWMEDNKKYNTWKIAQDVYKKRLVKVEYFIDKKEVELTTTHAIEYAKATKSVKLKQLAYEYNALLNTDAPISNLKQKALDLNNEVAKLEAAKTKRSKIALKNIDESKYTKERKDSAIWIKNDMSEADNEFRARTEQEWATASELEKKSATKYTGGSGSFNRPLRGFEDSWYNYKGVGKVDLDHEKSKENIDALTSFINKSISKKDVWIQRGIETKQGMSNFLGFGIDANKLNAMSNKELQSMVGKIVKDEGFVSCGSMKGTGFDGDILNIYCPRGTKMIYTEPFSVYNGDNLSVSNIWDGKAKYKLRSELETTLQRGSYFRITKIERMASGKLYIDIEVVGQI
jgi:hypothetical protein